MLGNFGFWGFNHALYGCAGMCNKYNTIQYNTYVVTGILVYTAVTVVEYFQHKPQKLKLALGSVYKNPRT
jgi:hypothetical protein